MLNRRRRRPLYVDVHLPPMRRRTKLAIVLVLIAAVLVSVGIRGAVYLRELSCSMVLSDATDLMTLCINDTISRKLASEDYDYDYFVTLEHDAEGNVTAVRANMARINAMSSELLSDIVKAADGGELSLEIPIGNLLGSSMMLCRWTEKPFHLKKHSSTRLDFKNELVSAGINQTKHQMKLDVVIDIDVIMPWRTVSTQVVSEILIAETVIVGQVPQTYLDMES